jgi:hypothetical protein
MTAREKAREKRRHEVVNVWMDEGEEYDHAAGRG